MTMKRIGEAFGSEQVVELWQGMRDFLEGIHGKL